MRNIGAISAYRGYRNQALYVLSRILKADAPLNSFFQPENLEDLTIYKDNLEIFEVIQVKDRTDNLSLSDFSPEKDSSFFRRSLKIIKDHPKATIKIVSFGPVGPELGGAWSGDRLGLRQCQMAGHRS